MKTSRFFLPLLATFALDATLPAEEQDHPQAEPNHFLERAAKAKREGRFDEARELLEQAKRKEAREGKHSKEQPDAHHKERFARMKQEIEDLRSTGDHEGAERRMREMQQQLEREQNVDRKGQAGEGPEKIRHIMEAVRHLQAAGLKEPARDLEQLARRMREEFEQQQQQRQRERQPDRDRGGDSSREVGELRTQVEKLTRELEKMREELKTHGGEESKRE